MPVTLNCKLVRRRLLKIAIVQLLILGMRLSSTIDLALKVFYHQTGIILYPGQGVNLRQHGGQGDLALLFYTALEQLFVFTCILYLIYGTKDGRETPIRMRLQILKRWMWLAGIYNWFFCITTALTVNWSEFTVKDIDVGKLFFVALNTSIFLFVLCYIKKCERDLELLLFQERVAAKERLALAAEDKGDKAADVKIQMPPRNLPTV